MKMSKLLGFLTVIVGTLALPAPEQQTKADPNLNWRIVGGSNADEGAFPYQISLRFDGGHVCGGSIISNTTILTAALCVFGTSVAGLTVVTGSTKLNSGGKEYQVLSIAFHDGFSTLTFKNDIAVIKVHGVIEFSSTVRPIELETLDVGGGEDAVLSGWGRTSFPRSKPNDLQFINLKTLTVEECKSALWPFHPVPDSQVCTLTQKGEGVCYGDSGGPLVADGRQIGIVSWWLPCARGKPDVFTRVSSYIDWIKEHSQ